jgi:hypothetical protein
MWGNELPYFLQGVSYIARKLQIGFNMNVRDSRVLDPRMVFGVMVYLYKDQIIRWINAAAQLHHPRLSIN